MSLFELLGTPFPAELDGGHPDVLGPDRFQRADDTTSVWLPQWAAMRS
jgi:hypothetical protein